MNTEKNHEEAKNATKKAPQTEKTSETDGEFKVTVRKLELPVRPRGVLAE